MAPTLLRAMRHAWRMLPAAGLVVAAACSDDTPTSTDSPAAQPLAAAAGLDVVSVTALEPFLDASVDRSEALDANDLRQVVGYSFNSYNDKERAALWDNSRYPIDLGSLGVSSRAEAISADGSVIAGNSYDGTAMHAVRWVKPAGTWVIDSLPSPKDNNGCVAVDVSSDGTVIGGVCTMPDGNHAIVWQNGAMHDLGTGQLSGVNSAGQAAVTRIAAPFRAQIRTTSGGITELGTLGADPSSAYDIDEQGNVVGYSRVLGGDVRGFLWTPKKGMTELPMLPGTTDVTPMGVAGDRIVGVSGDGGSKAYATLWQKGKVVDMGPLPGHISAIARSVTPGGIAVGVSLGTGSMRGTIWTLK